MTPRTVLLVDPDRDARLIYSLILEHHGYRVLPTASAVEGLALARRERPDVVVAELFQQTVEGDPLPVRLRREAELDRVPVVGLSSMAPHGVAPGEEACTVALRKPCTPSRVVEEVRRLTAAVPLLAS